MYYIYCSSESLITFTGARGRNLNTRSVSESGGGGGGGGGWGDTPIYDFNMSYIGMWRCEGYGFQRIYSRSLEIGLG